MQRIFRIVISNALREQCRILLRAGNSTISAGADSLSADALLSKEDIAKVAKRRAQAVDRQHGPALVQHHAADDAEGTRSRRRQSGELPAFDLHRIVDWSDLCAGFDELKDLMGMKFLAGLESQYVGG
jgi:hypothetical protein